ATFEEAGHGYSPFVLRVGSAEAALVSNDRRPYRNASGNWIVDGMRIHLIAVLAILMPLGAILTVAYWFVGDRIVRHVREREDKRYSILWPLNPRWHFEMSELGWFGEAQAAGYGRVLIAIYVGYALLFAVLLVGIYAGFVDTRP